MALLSVPCRPSFSTSVCGCVITHHNGLPGAALAYLSSGGLRLREVGVLVIVAP
jgi:hypothetical protein